MKLETCLHMAIKHLDGRLRNLTMSAFALCCSIQCV